ncbi:hypothetical protein GCM10010343_48800 [Streptomyces avidinii]|nr:hypothetical protein GCM10010343_48800 [Streptomyces avidinii]
MAAVYRSALPSSRSAQYATALAGTRRATSTMSTADRMVRTSPGKADAGPGASGVAAGGWWAVGRRGPLAPIILDI